MSGYVAEPLSTSKALSHTPNIMHCLQCIILGVCVMPFSQWRSNRMCKACSARGPSLWGPDEPRVGKMAPFWNPCRRARTNHCVFRLKIRLAVTFCDSGLSDSVRASLMINNSIALRRFCEDGRVVRGDVVHLLDAVTVAQSAREAGQSQLSRSRRISLNVRRLQTAAQTPLGSRNTRCNCISRRCTVVHTH